MENKVESLLLDVELLIQMLLERDALSDRRGITDNDVIALVIIKGLINAYKRAASNIGPESLRLDERLKHLRKRIMDLKHIPNRYERIIDEIKFKIQRCIDSI